MPAIRYYKMRGLADPGPGYVTWVVQSVPDFGAGEAPTPVQTNTAAVASSWDTSEIIQQTPASNVEYIDSVSASATATDPGLGVTFVNVDTSAGSWNDLDTIILPASPQEGAEVIVKNTGSPFKRITVDGNGNDIDGQASRVMSNPREALHMVFNGISWSII